MLYFCLINLFLFNIFHFFIRKNLSKLFKSSKIYYEESSWFDAKTWQKSIFLIKKDKLFYNQKFQKQLQKKYKEQKVLLYFTFLFLILII